MYNIRNSAINGKNLTSYLMVIVMFALSLTKDRFMLYEVNLKVRLVRNKDSFSRMSGEGNASYKVKIISAVLLVRKVHLSPSCLLGSRKSARVWIG